MTHRRQLAHCLHQKGTIVEFARASVNLPADNLVIDLIVARDADIVEAVLLSLENFNLQVDAIRADDNLGGRDLRCKVALVLIERIHGRNIFGVVLLTHTQTLVECLFVVGIALLQAENVVKVFGGVFAVTHPLDVAVVVFVAFVDCNRNANALGANNIDRVAHNHSIAIALRVVEVDDVVEILFELVIAQFGVMEDVDALLVDFLHNLAELFVIKHLVALEVNLADAHLLPLIHNKGYIHCVADYAVVLDAGSNLHISPTFVNVVVLDLIYTLFDVVVAQSLSTAFEFKLICEGGGCTLADTLKEPAENPWALREHDVQIHTVANGSCENLHIGEVLLGPKSGNCVRNLPARNCNLFALCQARRVDLQLRVEEFDTLGSDFANGVSFGGRVVCHRAIEVNAYGVALGGRLLDSHNVGFGLRPQTRRKSK